MAKAPSQISEDSKSYILIHIGLQLTPFPTNKQVKYQQYELKHTERTEQQLAFLTNWNWQNLIELIRWRTSYSVVLVKFVETRLEKNDLPLSR